MAIYTGDYFKHADYGPDHSIYYTFTPKPLSSGGFFVMDEMLAGVIASAHRVLGILEGLVMSTPVPALQELSQYKEAYYSWRIDNPGEDIYTFLCDKNSNSNRDTVNNIISATRYYCSQPLSGTHTDMAITIALHGPNSNVECTKRSGAQFLSPVSSNVKGYNPTHPHNLSRALHNLYKYISEDDTEILIKLALTHYQFEILHPYDSFNGIIGRIINIQLLRAAGIMAVDYLCLSEFLYSSKVEYFNCLTAAQANGEYTAWIMFLIGQVELAARRRIEQFSSYQQIVGRDTEKVSAHGRATANTMLVYNYFKQHIVAGTKSLAKELAINYNTARYSIDILLKLGIIQPVGENQRGVRFVYAELAKLLLSEES